MESNSIPPVLRKRLDDAERLARIKDEAGRLTFAEWLPNRGNDIADGWIVVAESIERSDEMRLTTSFLVPISDEQAYLDAETGAISVDDGSSAVIDDYMGEARRQQRDTSPLNPGARPFALHRSHYGYTPPRLELVQAYELYWNGWWEADVLRWIDRDGVVRDLARVRAEKDWRVLEVDAHHVRAFLTVSRAVLLRTHGHIRFSSDKIARRTEAEHKDESGRFTVLADDNLFAMGAEDQSIGRADGRDVVRGYEKLDGDPRVPKNAYERFLVARSADGVFREASADPDLASSYFTDTGNDHYLTQVFFRTEVLARYYSDPRRFKVQDEHVRCLNLWHIRFERSSGELLWVYLGDLGNLPYAEQRYWRTFNEVASVDVSTERFAQDFLVEWTGRPPDPVFEFLGGIEAVNRAAKAAFGKALIRPLNASDEHVRTGLRIPLSQSPEEADSQLTAMAKMIVEALDTTLLRSLVPKGVDVTGKKSLTLLEHVLSGSMTTGEVEAIMAPLFSVYYLRTHGSAHYRGSEWEETLQRTGLAGLGYREMVRESLRKAGESLLAIQAVIAAGIPAAASNATADGAKGYA